MKIQCSCGTKYSFDVTPEMARTPVRFVCQTCGRDSSDVVNQLVRQQLGTSAPTPPPAAPPVEAAPLAPAPAPVPPAPRVRLAAATPAAATAATSGSLRVQGSAPAAAAPSPLAASTPVAPKPSP